MDAEGAEPPDGAAAPQADALRHITQAEARAAATDSGCRIRSAVVAGGGTMGASIAHALTMAGIAVTIVETDAAGADRAQGNLKALRDRASARGLALPPAPDVVASYDRLPAAEIAIEAAFEDMGVKRAIFAQLAATLPRRTVLATNTSYLDVNRIAEAVPHPERILGLHFFSPAHVMRLVEIVRAEGTSDGTLALAYGLAAQLGKIPVAAGVCDGFIGNRILTRYRQTTDVMLLEGALPWQIDRAMQDFGMAMGPYAVQDLSGLDIAYANRRRLNLKDNPAHRYVPIADRMVEDLRRLGRKTGAGWYDYPDGKPMPSPVVAGVIEAASAEAGLIRRSFSDTEIQDRALTAMIDEACRILDEGIAARPSDIDLVMVHGYGFPRWRGGLMHYADSVGLGVFLDRVRHYRAQDALSWSEGRLMQRLVAEGRRLSDLN
jgi:3-hydroxyacyl-CoA dehydrogenase